MHSSYRKNVVTEQKCRRYARIMQYAVSVFWPFNSHHSTSNLGPGNTANTLNLLYSMVLVLYLEYSE
jgi:hypothetical protein